MKYLTFAALLASASANPDYYGQGCKGTPNVCEATGETCAEWLDSDNYPRFTCQDCTTGGPGARRLLKDEFDNVIEFICDSDAAMEMEGAQSLYASGAILAASIALMY